MNRSKTQAQFNKYYAFNRSVKNKAQANSYGNVSAISEHYRVLLRERINIQSLFAPFMEQLYRELQRVHELFQMMWVNTSRTWKVPFPVVKQMYMNKQENLHFIFCHKRDCYSAKVLKWLVCLVGAESHLGGIKSRILWYSAFYLEG